MGYILRTVKSSFLLITSVLLVIFFAGCQEAVGGFEEYAGVNLIETHPFDPPVPTDWLLSNGTYVNFTDRTAADATGLPSSADISGLTIPNLAANGDFENGTTGWTNGGFTSIAIDGGAIDGNTLDYAVNDAGAMITYNLLTLTDFDATSSYRFLFSYQMKSGYGAYLFFEVNDGASEISDLWKPEPATTTLSYEFPYDAPGDSSVVSQLDGSPFFAIGSVLGSPDVSTQAGYLDNFRVIRTHVAPTLITDATTVLDKSVYFDVPLVETGRLPLVSGTYRFSVWIRREESAFLTPLTQNSFQSNGISLRMANLGDGSSHTAFIPADSSWSSWQKVSVTGSLEIDSSTDPALRLSIMPTLGIDQDCGTMLVAVPELMLIP